MNPETKKPQKALRGWTLLIIAVIAYGASWALGNDSIVGSGAGVIGLIALLFAIIAFIREARERKKSKNHVDA